jgi:hypothetical protein
MRNQPTPQFAANPCESLQSPGRQMYAGRQKISTAQLHR